MMLNKTTSFGVLSSFLTFKIFSEITVIYSLCTNGLVDIIDSVSENEEILNVEGHTE